MEEVLREVDYFDAKEKAEKARRLSPMSVPAGVSASVPVRLCVLIAPSLREPCALLVCVCLACVVLLAFALCDVLLARSDCRLGRPRTHARLLAMWCAW